MPSSLSSKPVRVLMTPLRSPRTSAEWAATWMIWCPNWRPRALNSRWRCKSATQSTLPRACHPLASSRFPLASSRARCVSRGSRRGCPRSSARSAPTLLHSPHYTCPQFPGVPVVITLHDATFFSHPQAHSRTKQKFFTFAIRRAIRRAAALVVPSEATRDETIKYAGGDPSQFYVAYHGVDRSIFHPVDNAERARVKESLGLDGQEYIGFLGTLEPRKNVPNLVRGWTQAVSDLPNPPALVLAGGKAGMRTLTRPWRQSPRT